MSNDGQNDNQQQSNIDDRNILSQLFSRFDELSNAISPIGGPKLLHDNINSNIYIWAAYVSPRPVGDQVAVELKARRTFKSSEESTSNQVHDI